MLKPNLTKWNDSEELEGLLLFAQLIQEMLFDYTIDSYKPPALNTKSRCFELLATIDDIKKERLLSGTLKPMLDELAWSLENDIVAQKLIGFDLSPHKIFLKSDKNDIYTLETRINHMANTLGNKYLDQIKEELKESVKKSCLFIWDDVIENNNSQLIEFLRNKVTSFASTTPQIKVFDENNSIKATVGNNTILLKIDKDKMEMILTINDKKKEYFNLKIEDRKLNVYKKSFEKTKIELLTRLFITELLNTGFSEGNLYHLAKLMFFDGHRIIDTTEKLDNFINQFVPETKEWEVVVKGEKQFELIKQFVENVETSEVTPACRTKNYKEQSYYNQINSDWIYITFDKIMAYDALGAKTIVETILNTFSALVRYHIHKNELSWSEEIIVYDTNNRYSVLSSSVKSVYKRPEKKESDIQNSINETAGIFSDTNLDAESRYKLLQSINLHSAAISANDEKNQLLTFWAALESLLPPSRDKKKIGHVINHIVPLLVSGYNKKLISNLYKNLIVYDGVQDVINKVEESDSEFNKLAAIISLKKENEHLRDEIYVLIGRNPLLMHRIYSLMSKLSSANLILDTIEEHKKRVEWHIQRIYRMRNLIIHSGGSNLPYLSILVENLHAYTDTILDLIGDTIVHHPHLETLDEVMLEISLHNQSHIEVLNRNKEQACNTENYRLFLYGYPH